MSRRKALIYKNIDDLVNDIIDILNEYIYIHDLTYEEALTIAERVKLHLFAKYIDFRLSKMLELNHRFNEGENKIG